MKSVAAVCLVALGASPASGLIADRRIVPELHPKSDKEFFGPPFPADYPHDTNPMPPKTPFKHPYPDVQDHASFDADYVKDENSDNGEWKAQYEYDLMRAKVQKMRDHLKDTQKTADEKTKVVEAQKAETDKGKDDYEKALSVEQEAKKKVDEANKKHEDAEKAVKDAEEAAKTAGTELPSNATLEDKIKAAKDHVEERIENLGNCKKSLEEAQQALKDVLAEREKLQTDLEHASAEQKELAAKAAEQAKAVSGQVVAESNATKVVYAEKDQQEDTLKAQLQEAQRQYDEAEKERVDALKGFEQEQGTVEEEESKLKAAERKLRHARGEPVEPEEPATPARSSAPLATFSFLAAALLAVPTF